MDLINASILVLSLLTASPSKMAQERSVHPTLGIAPGMTKTDAIKALGEPYSSGYRMYAGDYMSYRGDMCTEGSCQLWFKNGRVDDIRGFKWAP